MAKNKKNKKPRGYVKRTPVQRERDMGYCSQLFLRGYNYRDIATALNKQLAEWGETYTISFSMVFYDIRELLVEWKRERLDNIDDYVTKELQKLDKMEQETWEAWEKSKGDKHKDVVRKPDGRGRPRKDGEPHRDEWGYIQNTVETCTGNPRFLDLLLNIQQRRAKLLGFDAPTKIEIPGLNVNVTDDRPKYDVTAIPEDMLFALADKLQAAEYKKVMAEKGGSNGTA